LSKKIEGCPADHGAVKVSGAIAPFGFKGKSAAMFCQLRGQ